ncbi:MAG: FkbM family methyltransferase [Cyclobacteriaceae bacterium]|nr:FkbM family methyltransferase [Cyclobacteriaceae bacterium]MBX2957447.1 FkbM family methyltransferase [Cyclobacteriaceae bacterium]
MKLVNSIKRLLSPRPSEWAIRIARDHKRVEKILSSTLKPNSNGIDIGCHEGSFLELFLKYAQHGRHWAFEPLPDYFEQLKTRFKTVSLHNFALSDQEDTTVFYKAVGAEAMSGFQLQHYPVSAQVEELHVTTKKLDSVIPENTLIDFIKIDVEGAELQVLKGAVQTIARCRPVIMFEFARVHVEAYGVTSREMFDFFLANNYKLFRLDQGEEYSQEGFEANFIHAHSTNYDRNAETNFLGIPKERI